MPHRRRRKSLAIFLSGMMCLFLWEASIYPVLGQGNDNGTSINNSGTIMIVVKHGESLWSLAQTYHTTVEKLVALNQVKAPNQIREGESLQVPDGDDSGKVIKTATGAAVDNTLETAYTLDTLDVPWWVSILRSVPTFASINNQRLSVSRSSNVLSNAQSAQPKIPTYEIIVNEDTELVDKTQTTATVPAPAETEGQILSKSLGRLVSKEEVELLTRVIYGEARGEDFEGQVAVGAVVLNRLKDPRFPKTMRAIIYQSGAFTAVTDKQIHLEPDDQAYKAAEAALSGLDPTNGAIYYYNPRIATDRWIKSRPVIKRIGNHTFSI